jgi:predicted lactoylglutathione lyase
MTSAQSPIPADLSMVVLTSADVPRLRRFYQALGWSEQAGATDELCRFQLGPLVLALYAEKQPVEQHQSIGASHMTLVLRLPRRELLDEAHRRAVDAGAGTVHPPTDHPWGGRSSVLADPDGNRWELLWVPQPEPDD